MSYQAKTTVITIAVGLWTEETDCNPSMRFQAAHAVALLIASRCQMDIMSLTPFPLETKGDDCRVTVVYVNNGYTFDDICRMMKPEIDNKPPFYWMIQDIYRWEGLLECIVATRGTNEGWN